MKSAVNSAVNSFSKKVVAMLICACPLMVWAQDNSSAETATFSAGTTDAQTGLSTRTWLKEQTESINRGEVEAYRAESAGKAYRAYVDSIGAKDQKAPTSQVSTIESN